jgi:hypothetical protein
MGKMGEYLVLFSHSVLGSCTYCGQSAHSAGLECEKSEGDCNRALSVCLSVCAQECPGG